MNFELLIAISLCLLASIPKLPSRCTKPSIDKALARMGLDEATHDYLGVDIDVNGRKERCRGWMLSGLSLHVFLLATPTK
jgi:hypothetical protein